MEIITYPEWTSAEKIKNYECCFASFYFADQPSECFVRTRRESEKWSNSFVDVLCTSYSLWDILKVDILKLIYYSLVCSVSYTAFFPRLPT